jgi:soluble lytic murein transglycosylase-like protein
MDEIREKEVDMEILELPLQTEHPPHWIAYIKKNGLPLRRVLIKVTLFLIIFSISFYLPNQVSEIKKRERTIQEILSVLESRQTDLSSVAKEDLAEAIYDEAVRYNYDPKFILALIDTESNFYNWAVSKAGAKGLMQIMPEVAQDLAQRMGIEWMGDRTLFNPYLNVKMGVYYLSELLKYFDHDLGTAVTAYNYGPTYVRGLLDRNEQLPLGYYKSILSTYQTL